MALPYEFACRWVWLESSPAAHRLLLLAGSLPVFYAMSTADKLLSDSNSSESLRRPNVTSTANAAGRFDAMHGVILVLHVSITCITPSCVLRVYLCTAHNTLHTSRCVQ